MIPKQTEIMLGYADFQRQVSKLWSKKVQNRKGCIWGAGLSGELLYFSLLRLGARIELIVDSDSRLWGNKFAGCISIESPRKLADHRGDLDFLCIASSSATAVQEITKAVRQIVNSKLWLLRVIDLWPEKHPNSAPVGPQPEQPPENWKALIQPLPSDLRWMRGAARGMSACMEFIIHIERVGSEARLSATLESLAAQIYPNWSAWVREKGGHRQIASGRRRAGDGRCPSTPVQSVVVKCRAGQRLSEHVLFSIAANHCLGRVKDGSHKPKVIDLRPGRVSRHARLLLPLLAVKTPRKRRKSKTGAPTFPIFLNKAPLRRFDPDAVRRIALLKLDHIGDAVMALPVIFDIRKRFPKAFILLISASWNRAFFDETLVRTHTIDRLETIDYFHERSENGPRRLSDAELAGFTTRLKPLNLDLAVDLRRQPDARPLLDAIPARWKLAFGDGDAACRLGLPSAFDTPNKDPQLHLGDELRVLIQAHMHPGLGSNLCLKLDRRRVHNLMGSHIPPQMRRLPYLLGLAPGAGHPVKCWPIAKFTALADLFAERLDAGILWFGSRSEAADISRAISSMRMPERALSLAGTVNIMDFMHLSAACDLLVGNDSGPAHLAASVGVPTLTVFSGQVSPFGVSSSGRHAFVLRAKPSCAPCFLQEGQCPYDRICLNAITPKLVFRATQIIMKTTATGHARDSSGRSRKSLGQPSMTSAENRK
jgi:ADP-heptose:LPS heptosyltransferase